MIETARRSSLALGTVAKQSGGALPGSEDADSLLDENASAVENTTGAWTFFLPDAFPK